MFVDSHCHLDRLNYGETFSDITKVIESAHQAGVTHMLSVCVTLPEFDAMKQMLADFPSVALTAGAHPLYIDEGFNKAKLLELAKDPQVVAVGETGLDYHYDKASAELQKTAFIAHIDVARELGKPLVIHTREARQETLSLLREHNACEVGGVLHCFTEDLAMAQAAIDLNFYISVSGIATFHSATELREVFAQLPIERLLIETDSPWLTPAPMRGKENHPALVTRVAEVLAQIKGISVEEVARITTENYFSLFKDAKRV